MLTKTVAVAPAKCREGEVAAVKNRDLSKELYDIAQRFEGGHPFGKLVNIANNINQVRKDAFAHGYLIAVASIMNLHGEDVIAEDVLQELGETADAIERLDLTEYDAEPLKALFAEIERKANLRRRRR